MDAGPRPLRSGREKSLEAIPDALFLMGDPGRVSALPGSEREAFLDRAPAALFLADFPFKRGLSGFSLSLNDGGDRIEMPGGEPFLDELALGLGQGNSPIEHSMKTPQVPAKAIGEAAQEEILLPGELQPRLDGHRRSSFHLPL
jgi:hypothetical protein